MNVLRYILPQGYINIVTIEENTYLNDGLYIKGHLK